MTKELPGKKELMGSLEKTTSSLLQLLEQFDENTINAVPFKDSWTAAQVADHVTKSNRSISKALLLKGTAINRQADERLPELKAVFLDFNTKLKSPEFILPAEGVYKKEILIANLAHSTGTVKDAGNNADLSAMINHPAFGDITKLEIIHFVLYHTQRHIHQLEKIYGQLYFNKS